MLSFFHLQSHSHRCQTFEEILHLDTPTRQIIHHGSHGPGILLRSLINERQFALPRLVGNRLAFQFADMSGYHRVVRRIEHHLSILEKLQLLLAFLIHRGKILLMRPADIRNHANRRLYDVAQRIHLSRLADTRLEDAHLRLLIKQPNRKRHANLRVIRTWRTGHHQIPRLIFFRNHTRKHLIQPFLHDGLTVRARDTHDGNTELITMALSQPLQGLLRMEHLQEVPVRILHRIIRWHLLHHEASHSAVIQFIYIPVSIVSFTLQSEEQRFFRKTEAPAVSQQEAHVRGRVAIAVCSDQSSNFLYCVIHNAKVLFVFQSAKQNWKKP